ncbi:hypothetical protein MBLNU459_g7628t1 [Dothideomycetes sp. NU459]
MPKHFQNYGDDDSENFRPSKLSENFESMSADEKETELELYRKRQETLEGDNTSLKAEIIKAAPFWDEMKSSKSEHESFPIHYSDEDIEQCLTIDKKQEDADEVMQTLRDHFPTNIDGWVSSDLFEEAKERAQHMRSEMYNTLATDEERKEFEEQWPFQDHDEID